MFREISIFYILSLHDALPISSAQGPACARLMDMSEHRTDPLRRLLDAVLDEESRTLSQMAGLAYTSPFHLSRTVSARSGEAPVALRRRVTLEQAAWRLRSEERRVGT